MKTKNYYVLIFLFFIIKITSAQDFTIIKSVGDSLREEGDLKGALVAYQEIYIKNPKDEINLYSYACCLAISKQSDSSFKYLNLTIELDTATVYLTDPDFISLKSDKRWFEFENRLIKMLEIKSKKPIKDIPYAKTLWRMQALDQAYYSDITIAEKKLGMNSSVVRALWDLKEMINNKNQKELELLISKKGWPKISMVGKRAGGAAFLIIQHSDSEKQKKYLPTIKKLCEINEASWDDYALMYDRIKVGEKKPQKFGSQITFNEKTNSYELLPLEDEHKVDEWRKEMGLPPLAEYVSMWGIKFEPKKSN